MKKLFAIVIALAMLLSAAALAEAADYTGVWYLNAMEAEGESYSPATFGIEMSIELKEDGTAAGTTASGQKHARRAGNGSFLFIPFPPREEDVFSKRRRSFAAAMIRHFGWLFFHSLYASSSDWNEDTTSAKTAASSTNPSTGRKSGIMSSGETR